MTDPAREYTGRRGVAKGSITRLVKFADRITERTPLTEIKTRLELLERSFTEFTECEMQLAKLDVPSEMAEYETKYLNIKSKFIELIEVPQAQQESTQVEKMMSRLLREQNEFLTTISGTFTSQLNQTVSQSLDEPHCSARLPRLNIPTFDGKYTDFPCFKDLFTASVHSKLGLSDVEKFQYLKGYVRGEPADLIKHITVSDANYIQAWAKLCNRYGKKKYVLNNLIKLFIEQPNNTQGSAKGLRRLYNVSDEVMRGMSVLGKEASQADVWLNYILLRKMDAETQQAWAHRTVSTDFSSFEELLKFISERADALEACEPSIGTLTRSNSTKVHQLTSSVESDEPVMSPKCTFCGDLHRIYGCDKFKKLDITQRREQATKLYMCFNCLSSSHRAKDCPSQSSCLKCGRKHHTLLHERYGPRANTSSNVTTTIVELAESEPISDEPTTIHATALHLSGDGSTFLPTAVVQLKNQHGQLAICKLLMDSGSQTSFISEKCFRRLGVPRQQGRIHVEGIATSTVSTNGRTTVTIHSRFDYSKHITIKAYILPTITKLTGNDTFQRSHEEKLKKLTLADPKFSENQEIDILLGADYFFYVLAPEQIQLTSQVVAQDTIFGYVIAGKPEYESNIEMKWTQLKNFTVVVTEEWNLEKLLRKFWEQEEILDDSPKPPGDDLCEKQFQATTIKNNEGRFIVQLPFKAERLPLGDSYQLALQRLFSMERKMCRNSEFKQMYVDFMTEYENLGHMKRLQRSEIQVKEREVFYLPHHGVLRHNNSSTKLRVVFDGSAASSNGVSLNDNLLIGSRLQDTLGTILLRFRTFKVAMCADIEKMYRQILIHPTQTSFQRILWRNSPSEPISQFELLTVTYGTSSAPFLAIRALIQIADDCVESHPDVARVIKENFYVDDVLTGADSEEKAVQLKKNLMEILKDHGCILRKWRSNSSKLSDSNELTQITEECRAEQVLGLYWDPVNDVFSFKSIDITNNIYTKRSVLSVASRIFDPLGWLSPFTVSVKIFMQGLWLKRLSWDDQLSPELQNTWNNIQNQFHSIKLIRIPRYVSNLTTNYQIHGFSDASELAYSAVIYIRMELNDVITTTLLTSKSKVAPIQQVSLPRLELCGAHLLAKLISHVLKSFKLPNSQIYLWTDSMVVLSWLSNHPRKWKTYVANRVSSIHQLLPDSTWRYIKGTENPADLATCGIRVDKLVSNDLWWKGPEWLSKPTNEWPHIPTVADTIQERHMGNKTNLLHIMIASSDDHPIRKLFDAISSWTRLIRIMAYVLRVVNMAKNIDKPVGYISTEELERAEIKVIQFVQASEFAVDIKSLLTGNRVQSNSKLVSLAPFIDSSGTLRVGGRLVNSTCSYSVKHPIILPSGHVIGRLILNSLHKKYLHPGPSLLTALSRQKYWIIGVRTASRSLCKKCVVCYRHSTLRSTQQMGSLPGSRVIPSRPFSIVGVDYAGPLTLSSKKGRGAKFIKGFLVIFVCFATKAIHIEVASDLTTDAFLAALDRFVARRGVPSDMYSDNGSNFLGAKRKLFEHYKLIASTEFNVKIHEYAPSQNIKWHFIPPIAPHFGGLWERAVRSVKSHLIKVIGTAHLTFEEMTTVTTKIEGILNSRPLCAITNEDTCNIDALTPAHFLSLGPVTALPCPNYEEINMDRLTRWERIQKLVQTFWRQYHISYLNTLQQRTKWQGKERNFEINDIVLLHDNNSPPCVWPLGRIIDVHKGNDGLIRVATVKTKSSMFKRPITKLYRLPLND